MALNLCGRDIATHIGIHGRDTITIVLDQYQYTLNDNFYQDSVKSLDIKAKAISAEGHHVWSLSRSVDLEFDNYESAHDKAEVFDIDGNVFWVSPAEPEGDMIYLSIPILFDPQLHGADTVNVLQQDQGAWCDCMSARYGVGMQHSQAAWFWEKFKAHILTRGGNIEGLVGP